MYSIEIYIALPITCHSLSIIHYLSYLALIYFLLSFVQSTADYYRLREDGFRHSLHISGK